MRKEIFETNREADDFVHTILDGRPYKEKDEALKRIIENGLIKKYDIGELKEKIKSLNDTPISKMATEEIDSLYYHTELLKDELRMIS